MFVETTTRRLVDDISRSQQDRRGHTAAAPLNNSEILSTDSTYYTYDGALHAARRDDDEFMSIEVGMLQICIAMVQRCVVFVVGSNV